MAEAADLWGVDAGLDGEDHPRLDRRAVADVEERRLVVAETDRVTGVLAPERQQVDRLEVAEHGLVDVSARGAGPDRVERGLLRREHVVEQAPHLLGRRA